MNRNESYREKNRGPAYVRRFVTQKPQKFLVKWLGYPSSENTWYKPEELSHANEILDEYKKTHNLL